MKHPVQCNQCSQSIGWEDASYSVPIGDDERIEFTCRFGHKSVIVLVSAKFELLTEVAMQAIVDGYYRDGVSSTAASLERFYEFVFRFLMTNSGVPQTTQDETWRKVRKQSERQLGLFLASFSHIFQHNPLTLSDADTGFRNRVIHEGYIPHRDEAVAFVQSVVDVIQGNLRTLIIRFGREPINFKLAVAHDKAAAVQGARPTVSQNKSFYAWEGMNGDAASIPETVAVEKELRIRAIRPDTPRPLYRVEAGRPSWQSRVNGAPAILTAEDFTKLRREAAITQRGISVELGLDTEFVEKIEAGQEPISPVIELALYEVLRRRDLSWPGKIMPNGDNHLEGIRRHIGYLIQDFRHVRSGDREAAVRSAKSLDALYGVPPDMFMGLEMNCVTTFSTVRERNPEDDPSYTDLRMELPLDLSASVLPEYEEPMRGSDSWWKQPVFLFEHREISRKDIVQDLSELFDQYWRNFDRACPDPTISPRSLSQTAHELLSEERCHLIARFAWEAIQSLAHYGIGIRSQVRQAVD